MDVYVKLRLVIEQVIVGTLWLYRFPIAGLHPMSVFIVATVSRQLLHKLIAACAFLAGRTSCRRESAVFGSKDSGRLAPKGPKRSF